MFLFDLNCFLLLHHTSETRSLLSVWHRVKSKKQHLFIAHDLKYLFTRIYLLSNCPERNCSTADLPPGGSTTPRRETDYELLPNYHNSVLKCLKTGLTKSFDTINPTFFMVTI